jgi:hypothetical protein
VAGAPGGGQPRSIEILYLDVGILDVGIDGPGDPGSPPFLDLSL